MRIRYFVRRSGSEPWYVFRILLGVRLQVYDVAGHSWRREPLEPLYRLAVIGGEMGVDEIDEAWALEIIHSFRRRLPRHQGLPGHPQSVFNPGADTPQFRLVE